MQIDFKNRSVKSTFQTSFVSQIDQNIQEYSPVRKTVVLLIRGLDGGTVDVESVTSFKSKFPSVNVVLYFFEKFNRLHGNYVVDEWNEYFERRVVSKAYDVDELLKVVVRDEQDSRYARLLEIWESCMKGRGLISTAIQQRNEMDAHLQLTGAETSGGSLTSAPPWNSMQ